MKNDNVKMDLQLFADASASLQNTTGTMTKEMKTFYEKRLIDQAEPRLVHDQFADYYPVPQNGGKTIEFRKYDSLPKADTPLTEGVTPNGQALNVTTITSDLHQYGGWTPLTDVLQMTAIDNNVVQATRVLASQAGRTLDTITPRCAGRRHQCDLCAQDGGGRHRDRRDQPPESGQDLHPDPEAVLSGGGAAGRDER